MDVWTQSSIKTPLTNSTLFPLLLLSLMRQKHAPDCTENIKKEYDYIIVGGGTAGSVVAGRLSEEPCVSILVLEAGPKPPLITEVPEIRHHLEGTDVDWNFEVVPQKHLNTAYIDKNMRWVQGKMLGGSGSLNNLFYARGNRKNYDDWAALGAKGWSYKDVFSYFLKLEDNRDIFKLDEGFHNIGGPISVERPHFHSHMKQALHNVAEELGCKFVDPNGAKQKGFYHHQLNTRDGQRCSSVKGYLVPAEHRPNLDIFVNATVTKVIIKNNKVKGVTFYSNGESQTVKARKEVIVSAGVANTPKLLMLSGIGPKEELEKWNIPVISNLPVGKNLQDHGVANLYFTIDHQYSIWDNFFDPLTMESYIGNRSGKLANNDFAGSAFFSSNTTSQNDYPNYSIGIVEPLITSSEEWPSLKLKPEIKQLFGPADKNRRLCKCFSQHLQPKSIGTITLKSPDPFDPPVIDPNYLENPQDVEDIADGLIMCQKIINSKSFQRYGAKLFDNLMPGCENFANSEKDYFKCYTRRMFATAFHGVGTAKMGNPNDPSTVVDTKLRVKGVKGLRVVDASIMPIIPSLNTNIPTIMVAEKASDIIKKSIKCYKKY